MTGELSAPQLEAFTENASTPARGAASTRVVSRPPCATSMGADADEQALMARIVARDNRAIADLYDRYSRLLFSLAYRMLQNRGDAEEVLQEVFLAVWTRVSTYDQALGSLAAWLVRITRNRAIDRLRALRADTRVATHVVAPEPAPAPEASVQRTELRRMATDALRTLSSEHRALILTAYFEGLSQSELAARFQLPLVTVKTRIRTGLKSLHAALGPVLTPVRRGVTAHLGCFETDTSITANHPSWQDASSKTEHGPEQEANESRPGHEPVSCCTARPMRE